MLRRLVGSGIVIGIAFPLVASLFVEPKSTVAQWLFVAMCIAAGVVLAIIAHAIALGMAEKVLAETLQGAARSLGVSVQGAQGLDGLRSELGRVLSNVSNLLDQIRAPTRTYERSLQK